MARWAMGILCVVCCAGVLGIRLLASIFPVSLSSPRFGTAQPLGDGEAIVFSVMRVDVLWPFQLYVLDVHGVRPISQGLYRSDIGPAWSPDGAQIAYQSVAGGATRYYLVDAHGANGRELTPDDRHKRLLRWSSDGSRLAYLAYGQNPDGSLSNAAHLCVLEVGTGDIHQAPSAGIQDFVWMPDGQSLLAVVRAADSATIESYDAEGNGEGRISEADFLRDAAYIALSPDGNRVAYIRPMADEDLASAADELYVSALDGSAARFVGNLWPEGSIVWSPDSARIAFVAFAYEQAQYALHVADAEGTNLRQLMLVNVGDESGEMLPAAPAWSPDGKRIAIGSVSSPKGCALFVMNADGTERREIVALAGSGAMIYDLAWRPREQGVRGD